MAGKPTNKELGKRLKALEKEIARLKQVEESLKTSEANLAAQIENTKDIIYSFDHEMHLLTFNSAYVESVKIYDHLSLFVFPTSVGMNRQGVGQACPPSYKGMD